MNAQTSGSVDTPVWVLCHGTPLTPSVWAGVAAVLRRHGPVHQPLLVASGRGESLVTSLAQSIVDQLPPGGRVQLVGHSFGGQVALEAALIAGPLVETLTMICSRDTPFPPFSTAAQELRSGVPADPDAVLRRWFRPDELVETDPLVQYARTCVLDADRDAWAACLEAIASFDRSRLTKSLHIPVHLVTAELDQVATVAAMSAMAHRLPRARLTVLADAAHLSAFRQPEMLAGLITSTALKSSAGMTRQP